MKKIKEIFENAIEKFVDFVDEHPVLTPILVSAIASFITTIIMVFLKIN